MLESAEGAVSYVIRKLNQVRENGPSSQSRFEAIEIIEAVILALVAVATAWSRVPGSTVGWKACGAIRRGEPAPSHC
jgi:hypothetical protein